MLQQCYNGHAAEPRDGKVTVTVGKVPVTAAVRRKIRLHPGMCNAISSVRSYVAVTGEKASRLPVRPEEKDGKSEKRK